MASQPNSSLREVQGFLTDTGQCLARMTLPRMNVGAEEPLREAPARTTFMTKTHGSRRPLERSKLSTVARREQPRARAPGDDSEFYSNIWAAEPGAKSAPRLVDISQVAHVLTTIDYRDGYEGPAREQLVNLWTGMQLGSIRKGTRVPPSTAPSAFASVSVSSCGQQRHLSEVSVAISEHESEDDDGSEENNDGHWRRHGALSYAKSGALAGMPMTTGSKRVTFMERQLSEESLSRASSIPVSAPSRRGEHVVFSTVLARHEDIDMSWNSQFLLGLHEPIRHALFVIDRFLGRSHSTAAGVDWNVSEFFHWFKEHFVEFVKNQHHVKSVVLLPLLAVKFTDKREISACYNAIFLLIDGILGQEEQLISVASSERAWQERLQTLQGDIRRLNFLLLNVLSLEEEALKVAIGESFTEQTFQRFVMPRIIRHSRPKRVVIPWIVERSRVWGGEKVAHQYRDELPFTARFMYGHAWHPYFVSHIASAMKNLGQSSDVLADDSGESWFGCTVQ